MKKIFIVFILSIVSIISYAQKPENSIYIDNKIEILKGNNTKNESVIWMHDINCKNTFFAIGGNKHVNDLKNILIKSKKLKGSNKKLNLNNLCIWFNGNAYGCNKSQVFYLVENNVEYIVIHSNFYYTYKNYLSYYDDRTLMRNDVHVDNIYGVFQEVTKLYEAYLIMEYSEIDTIINTI